MRPGTLEESSGDVTKIECPHPTQADKFIEVASIQGASERPTTQLVGRFPADQASTLKEFQKLGCAFDLHINIGICKDISLVNTFVKKLILEDDKISNYALGELGTLSSDGRAEVDETADISMALWDEILPMGFAERAGTVVTNEVIDVVICDNAGCGDCEDPSDGCEKIFALTTTAGGSPSTPADIVYSIDKGATWQAVDIDTLGAAEAPSALACVGEFLVVVSNDSASLHYALLSEFVAAGTPPTWTEVTAGFVAGGEPNDIWAVEGGTAFICGDGGYVYTTTDPTAGVTTLDAGVAVQDDLQAIHAISATKFVAVGNAGAIVKSENGSTVAEVTPSPVGVGVNFTSIWIKANNGNEWFIGANNGNYYYTVNNGVTFVLGSFSGSGTGVVRDIAFSTKSVGYLAHDTATPAGRIFRTYDGGKSWVLTPDQSTATLPVNDRITALAACTEDPNFVVGVGLADNATDGIILVGED